jgi:hypothetical protein
MRSLRNFGLAAAIAAGAAAVGVGSASAAIVCTRDVCWHTREAYDYPPDAHVTVHPDSWKWGPSDHYTWREHEGRGYWRDDKWTDW